jgi:diguanylate cyclase (GGDEF)-like protein
MTIGRSPEAQLMISEPSVSRQHCCIMQSGSHVDVEDLGSSNGTFINDVRVASKASLKDGDMLRLGTILLKFFAHDNIESIMADKIYRMATIDAGTQIYNKQYLMDSLESEFKFSKTYKRPLCVIYFDLDHFKKVNDTYGHGAGDIVLKECANLVKSVSRKDDILGRYGGEEFVVVLPNTDLKFAAELAERIRAAVAAHSFEFQVEQDGQRRAVQHKQTISMGVAELQFTHQTMEQLLESADQKLYSSKQTGRNKVTV